MYDSPRQQRMTRVIAQMTVRNEDTRIAEKSIWIASTRVGRLWRDATSGDWSLEWTDPISGKTIRLKYQLDGEQSVEVAVGWAMTNLAELTAMQQEAGEREG